MAQTSVALIDDGEEVAAVASPLRRRILGALREPDSAAGVARRLGVARQKITYHVRQLERAGLIEFVDERQARGFTERLYRATARSFVFSPGATGLAGDLDAARDRFASDTLIGTASRMVDDVAALQVRAARASERLATLTIDGEVRLASPADLAAFGEEVARAVAEIADRYRAERGGRRFRFVTGVHPVITKPKEEA